MKVLGRLCTGRAIAAIVSAVLASSALAGGSSCPADLNDNGVVDGADLTILLGSWGPCAGCPADIDGSGVVGGADLTILLGSWGPCPVVSACPASDHNCFTSGSAGCTDQTCCEAVCAADPFCCGVSWDGLCVSGAVQLCGDAACLGADHTCCVTGGPGCTDALCCNQVCVVDPFCCATSWDSLCVGGAKNICGLTCGNPACPNPEHTCFTTGTPGCSDTACCVTVCVVDPFCCSTSWDGLCVNGAYELCACEGSDHGCFVSGGPGCSDTDCCVSVCIADPFCCTTSWDGLCVGSALQLCGDAACPNPAHGCFTTGSAGCSDATCCNIVCLVDPFCCNTSWDSLCVNQAFEFCACEGSNHGCFTTGSAGCSDTDCCVSVCIVDPFCCSTSWDGLCVNGAYELCACEGSDHGCFVTGGPGCSDTDCCVTVCIADPFCCTTSWDGICVNNAVQQCGDAACLNANHACNVTGGPGCTNGACCNIVCAVDPFCCNNSWDGLCVNQAGQLCP